MRYILTLLIILGFYSLVYADRVCLEKDTGKLIEYQSGDAPLGTLTENAVNVGYKKEDVEEKYITNEEWILIREEQIDKPAREKAEQKERERKEKENIIKTKLNLTNEDFKNLKDALKD